MRILLWDHFSQNLFKNTRIFSNWIHHLFTTLTSLAAWQLQHGSLRHGGRKMKMWLFLIFVCFHVILGPSKNNVPITGTVVDETYAVQTRVKPWRCISCWRDIIVENNIYLLLLNSTVRPRVRRTVVPWDIMPISRRFMSVARRPKFVCG